MLKRTRPGLSILKRLHCGRCDAERVAELGRTLSAEPAVLAWAPFAEEQGLLRSRLVPGGKAALVKGKS